MEYSYGWMPDLAWEGWDEERRVIESELEMQIWRWALLEAHLWGASQVYESLMGSPLAQVAQVSQPNIAVLKGLNGCY